MSYLKDEITKLLTKEGWKVESIMPVKGYWRSSSFADCYRWEIQASPPNSSLYSIFGCWETMTDFVRNSKNTGFSYSYKDQEIWSTWDKL